MDAYIKVRLDDPADAFYEAVEKLELLPGDDVVLMTSSLLEQLLPIPSRQPAPVPAEDEPEAVELSIENYPDNQIRQELVDFFASWKPDDVLKLSARELHVWKRHALALRQAGFWWVSR